MGNVAAERHKSPDGAPRAAPEAEVVELKDRLLRALAEQENIRRRAARERDESVRFAASNLARDLLPTLDNLRRALDSVPAELTGGLDEPAVKLLAGGAATERRPLEALARHGVSRIDPVPGEAFDPHFYQVMFEVDGSSYPAGTVAQILPPGYVQHERLLRPALGRPRDHEQQRPGPLKRRPPGRPADSRYAGYLTGRFCRGTGRYSTPPACERMGCG
jgi:molecular chaperone GrpE